MTTPFAGFAERPEALLLAFVWAVLEATVLPIVPDVLIGLLVLAAPWRLIPLLVAAVAGGVLGGVGWWWFLGVRPAAAERILVAQPGLGAVGVREARVRLARVGDVRAFAQVGPGLPLKAHVAALAASTSGARVGRVVWLIVVNRLTRLGPVVVAFALAAPVTARPADPPEVLAAVYVTGWAVFYAAYWLRRGSGGHGDR